MIMMSGRGTTMFPGQLSEETTATTTDAKTSTATETEAENNTTISAIRAAPISTSDRVVRLDNNHTTFRNCHSFVLPLEQQEQLNKEHPPNGLSLPAQDGDQNLSSQQRQEDKQEQQKCHCLKRRNHYLRRRQEQQQQEQQQEQQQYIGNSHSNTTRSHHESFIFRVRLQRRLVPWLSVYRLVWLWSLLSLALTNHSTAPTGGRSWQYSLLRSISNSIGNSNFFFGVVMVEAKCHVKNSNGVELSLDGDGEDSDNGGDKKKSLPAGMKYEKGFDRITCFRADGCKNYFIANCFEVVCQSYKACENTHLTNVDRVTCSSNNACLNALIQNGHQVFCGGKFTNQFCRRTRMEIDRTLTCEGPAACVAREYDDYMTVNLGAKGSVYCGNLNNHDLACANMIVEVNHQQRACFAQYGRLEQNKCAIYCARPHDCDKTSIHFVVQ